MGRRLISFPGIETAYADLTDVAASAEFTVSVGGQDYNITAQQIFAILGLDPANLVENGGGAVTATGLAPNTDFGFFSTNGAGLAFPDNTSITLARLQNISTGVFLGRDTQNDGPIEQLDMDAARQLLELDAQGAAYVTALQGIPEADRRAHSLAMLALVLLAGETWSEDAFLAMSGTPNTVKPVTPIPDAVATGGDILDGTGADLSVYADSYGQALQPKSGNLVDDDLTLDLSSGGDRGLNYSETIAANMVLSITDIANEWLGAHLLRVSLTNSDTTAWTITYTDTDEVKFQPATGVTPPSAMPTAAGATLVLVFDLLPGSPKKRAALINHYVVAP